MTAATLEIKSFSHGSTPNKLLPFISNKKRTVVQYRNIQPLQNIIYGNSDAAQNIRNSLNSIRTHLDQSWSLASEKKELLQKMSGIWERCSVDQWDGYKALQLKRASLTNALLFIETLPSDIALPDLVPEPTGYLGMLWENKDNSIAISIDENAHLSFGAIGKDNSILYGSSKLTGRIPENIITIIRNAM